MNDIEQLRNATGLGVREASELMGISRVTWARYEGKTGKPATMPQAMRDMFLLKTDTHPEYKLVPRR